MDGSAARLDAYLRGQEKKDLLRFITCGSVDDGKSTLIGRLLYEGKMLFDDQLSALESDSKKVMSNTPGTWQPVPLRPTSRSSSGMSTAARSF